MSNALDMSRSELALSAHGSALVMYGDDDADIEVVTYNEQRAAALIHKLTNADPKWGTNWTPEFLGKNPFWALGLKADHTIPQLQRATRRVTCLLGEENADERAAACLELCNIHITALSSLASRERILFGAMEARERVDKQRKKENRKRAKEMLPELPISGPSFEQEVEREMFQEMGSLHMKNENESRVKAEIKEKQKEKKAKKEEEAKIEKAWEGNRDSRVSNWRDFGKKQKRKKATHARALGKYAPPGVKAEKKVEYDKEVQSLGSTAIQTGEMIYKKHWK